MSDVRERMQETAALVTATLPPGTGFVILAFDFGPAPGRMEYISNAQRGDIVKVMREWIAKTEKQFMSHESPFAPQEGEAWVKAMTERDKWRTLAIALADRAQTCLDNAHWEVRFGCGDLINTIQTVRMLEASNESS